MTTLLIQTDNVPLTGNSPSIAIMNDEQFYAFCQANRDLRIERSATGEVIILPHAFSDTGNRNSKLLNSLRTGLIKTAQVNPSTPARALPSPTELPGHPMVPGMFCRDQ